VKVPADGTARLKLEPLATHATGGTPRMGLTASWWSRPLALSDGFIGPTAPCLHAPQPRSSPAVDRKIVCTLPVEAAAMGVALSASTRAGPGRSVRSPWPSWPKLLRPQAKASPSTPTATTWAEVQPEETDAILMLPRPERSRRGPKRLGASSVCAAVPILAKCVEPHVRSTPSAGTVAVGVFTSAAGGSAGSAAADSLEPAADSAALAAIWACILAYMAWAPPYDIVGSVGKQRVERAGVKSFASCVSRSRAWPFSRPPRSGLSCSCSTSRLCVSVALILGRRDDERR